MKRNIDRLTGIDLRMHQYIIDDIYKRKSLIISALHDRFIQYCEEHNVTEVCPKEIMPQKKAHDENKIGFSNAKKQIKAIINNKMSNMRRSKKDDSNVSSFTILELLDYCEMLRINPISVLLDKDYSSLLFPVQYSTGEEILSLLEKVENEPPINKAIHIPFLAAPIIGVNLDVYFFSTDNCGKYLDDNIVIGTYAVVERDRRRGRVENSSCKSTMENYVMMKIILTSKSQNDKEDYLPEVVRIRKNKTSDGTSMIKYLRNGETCFYRKCGDRYEEEKNLIDNIAALYTENPVASFFSDTFATVFKSYVSTNTAKIETDSFLRVYPRSQLDYNLSNLKSMKLDSFSVFSR